MANKMISDNIRLINIILIVLMVNVLMGCISDIFSTKPKASFEYHPSKNIKTGDTIRFINNSKNADLYHWDFGDSSSAYVKDPKHVFKNKRIYLVKLYASKQSEDEGDFEIVTDSLCKDLNVSIITPKAEFFLKRTSILTVTIKDSTIDATEYRWDFGDGNISTEREPTHTYNSFGTYKVTLTASNRDASALLSKMIELKEVISLNNIKPTLYPGPRVSVDVDFDDVIDFEFYIFYQSHPISLFTYEASSISAFNGYEIFSDTVIVNQYYTPNLGNSINVTMVIPRIYSQGSTILNSTTTKTGNLTLCKYSYDGHGLSYELDDWISNADRYVGFRKVVGDKTKIGWIKLQIADYASVTLRSFKIPTDGESLVIDK